MIITNNEDALRVKCESVSSDEVSNLILQLESELDRANRLGRGGIGLAAPQIGINKKIAIVRMGNNNNIDLVNCTIDKGFDSSIFRHEGCLSFPGRVEDTIRFQEIYVTNNLVYPHTFIATGLTSVVVQHELDHVNSVLFMDRVSSKPSLKKRIKPNDPCMCLSGKKYKKCCGG